MFPSYGSDGQPGQMHTPMQQMHTPMQQMQNPMQQMHTPMQHMQSPMQQMQSPMQQMQSPMQQMQSPMQSQMQSQMQSPMQSPMQNQMHQTPFGQRIRGVLTSWKPPWGWATSNDFPGDIFVHVQDVINGGTVSKGLEIEFELGNDPRTGRARAAKIEVLGYSPSSASRLEGIVTSYKSPWGWASCPQVSGDIFVHDNDVMNGCRLQKDAVITFEMVVDPKSGRNRAMRVEVQGIGGAGAELGTVCGTVTNWKDKWGWITCTTVAEGDVFAHIHDCSPGWVPTAGRSVTMLLGFDHKGRRRAMNIMPVDPDIMQGPQDSAQQQTMHQNLQQSVQQQFPAQQSMQHGLVQPVPAIPEEVKQQQEQMIQQMTQQQMAANAQRNPPMGGFGDGAVTDPNNPGPEMFIGHRLSGQMTSWKDRWGWISSPAFSTDLFAHIDDIAGGFPLGVGTEVYFTVGYDNKTTNKRGRLRALNIQPMDPSSVASNAVITASVPNNVPALPAGFEGCEGETLQGTIASWSSPCGWIKSEGFAGDVFAHKDDITDGTAELAVGQSVIYVLGKDPGTGQWRAREINRAPDPPHKRQRLQEGFSPGFSPGFSEGFSDGRQI